MRSSIWNQKEQLHQKMPNGLDLEKVPPLLSAPWGAGRGEELFQCPNIPGPVISEPTKLAGSERISHHSLLTDPSIKAKFKILVSFMPVACACNVPSDGNFVVVRTPKNVSPLVIACQSVPK